MLPTEALVSACRCLHPRCCYFVLWLRRDLSSGAAEAPSTSTTSAWLSGGQAPRPPRQGDFQASLVADVPKAAGPGPTLRRRLLVLKGFSLRVEAAPRRPPGRTPVDLFADKQRVNRGGHRFNMHHPNSVKELQVCGRVDGLKDPSPTVSIMSCCSRKTMERIFQQQNRRMKEGFLGPETTAQKSGES